jgi:nitrite reductase/ring-hydroxylating ferredoxin subunit
MPASGMKLIIMRTQGSIQVADAGELKVNAMKLLHCKNKRIVLGRTENNYVAFEDRCPHKGGPLSDGNMQCNTVQCPWHGSQFDVTNGELKAGPAKQGIKIYEVKEVEGKVFLIL